MSSTRRCHALLLLAAALVACGGDSNTTPDAFVAPDAPPDAAVDAAPDAIPTDAAESFGLTAVFPTAASRTVDTELTLSGYGVNGTPAIKLINCDQASTTYDVVTGTTTATSITTTLPAAVDRVQGLYTIAVTNGDGMMASLTCALRILAAPPPTVTLVVPTTAYQGVATDNINSDVTVSIEGTGFVSTPNVRWVSTTDPSIGYDAAFVGFTSPTALTAVAPSESATMQAGTYNVFVTNPDTLSGEWLNGTTPGEFTVTTTAPPDITTVTPARIQNNGTCATTTLTLSGSGFVTGATAWYVAPAGTTCAGSSTDANGQLVCPLTVATVDPTALTATLPSCPALGIYPLLVVNPDGQADYYYSIEITPSSDGHLSADPWELEGNRLVTARYKHAVQFGFDAFAHAIVYVAGGQDAAGAVLGSVEASLFDIFGTPGPFQVVQQYGDATTPRVPNTLTTPREGLTLQRVGKSLFAIGGTAQRSDSTTPVAASAVVERAQILSYAEVPAIKTPTASGTTGLPLGSWYYRVAAIGPWGESLATREVVAINKSGVVQVCWTAPTTAGATAYNVYRSLASDGRAGTSVALAYEVAPASLCFDDDGTGPLTPAPGNARGSVAAGGTLAAGTYTYRIAAVVPPATGTFETQTGYATATEITAADVTAATQTITLAWDPLPTAGITYRVYRLDPGTGAYRLLAGADALTAAAFTDGGVAFDASDAAPRDGVLPLPTGSLSRWTTTDVPQLTTAREGVDGVVIALDPATSNDLVARILVAGGRDGTGGAYAYLKTAESLGVYADGSTESAWAAETPQFTFARAYYALLTTQNRNDTPFPPPPEPPTDNGDLLLKTAPTGVGWWRTDEVATASALAGAPGMLADVVGTEPVHVIAVMGDDAFAATQNQGRNDFEACAVDATTGHLACTAWAVQTSNDPQSTFGADAVLYFSYLYPFYGIARETVGTLTTTIQHVSSAIGRFPLADLATVIAGQILGNRQSANSTVGIKRAYYQMTRLLANVYVVGGYAEAHTEGALAVPAGPTGLVERHQQ